MSYVLTDGATTVVEYPYSIGMLRRDNPSVSFPANPTDAQLAEWNVFPVAPASVPSYDPLSQDVGEDDPSTADGGVTWTQVWVVTNVDAPTAAQRYADAAAIADAEANRRLQDTEQYYLDAMVAGYGFHADMVAYVTALESPATLPNYPLVSSWPTLPATILDPANPDLPVNIYTKAQVDAEFVKHVQLNEAINTYVSGNYLALAGGTMQGAVDMDGYSIVGLPDPLLDDHATNKLYVDSEISNAVAPLALLPRLTINLQTDTGSITTLPKIADALTTIGTTNGYTINLGFGEYRETGPIVFDDKWQLNVVGVHSANTTAATIKNGVTIQNSNGVRFFKVQVEGTSSIACRAGLGQQFERSQFMGNLTLSGTGGFMIFTDCEFAGNVTVDAAFAGVIYFVRCSFSNASGVYTFSQASAVQVIISDSTGLPNTQPAKVSYAGNIVTKNNVQKFYINNVALNPLGATNGQVLQLVSGTSNEWVPRTLTMFPWTSIALENTAGSKTISTASWNAFKTAYRDIQIMGITSTGHVFAHTINTAAIDAGRTLEAHHAAHGSDDEVSVVFGAMTGNTYTLSFTGDVAQFYIYGR